MSQDTTTIYTVDQLREIIAPIARRLGFEKVWLFGSYARGQARGDSDIDLLVNNDDLGLARARELTRDVKAATGKEAEVFTWQGLTPDSFREKCQRESVLLYKSASL